jgi:hypothetical protein
MLGQLSERKLDYYISPFGIVHQQHATLVS